MARKRTPKQRRQAAQRAIIALATAAPQHGDLVFVTRWFPDGRSVRYRAFLIVEVDGRTRLEPVKDARQAKQAFDRGRVFVVAKSNPIKGYRDWFMISGAPVNLDSGVRWEQSPIKRLMMLAPYSD